MTKRLSVLAIGIIISVVILLSPQVIPPPVNPNDCFAVRYNPQPAAWYLAIFIWFCLTSYLILSTWRDRRIAVPIGIVGTLIFIWLFLNFGSYLPLPCTPVIAENENRFAIYLLVFVLAWIVFLIFLFVMTGQSMRPAADSSASDTSQQNNSAEREFSKHSLIDTPTHARKSAKSSVRLAKENTGDWMGGYLKAKVCYVSGHFEVQRSDGHFLYGQSSSQAAELLAREWLLELRNLDGKDRERAVNMLEIEASMDESIE